MNGNWMTGLVLMLCLLIFPLGLAHAGGSQRRVLGPGAHLDNVHFQFEIDGKETVSVNKSYVLPRGRMSRRPDGTSMYVAKLPKFHVTISSDRGVDVTPAIRVAIDKQGQQSVTMSLQYNGRNTALGATTDFLATITVMVDGKSQRIVHHAYVGCVDGATLITMFDGARVRIDSLVEGEFVLNPLTGAAMEIARIIQGPEPNPLIRVGDGENAVLFSAEHPVWTDRGFVLAEDLEVGDLIADGASVAHPITVREMIPLDPHQIVYNLRFVGVSARPEDHVFLAGGIVVGDGWLQERLGHASR